MSDQTGTVPLSLDELLSYDNEQFVEGAYTALLGRKPDTEGMDYYLTRLQAGISKVEILAQIGNSAEGKARQIKIEGLDEAVRYQKRLKTPLLGGLLRLAEIQQTKKNKQHFVAAAEVQKSQKVAVLLGSYGLSEDSLPSGLNLDIIHHLNPLDHFDDYYQAIAAIVLQTPIRKLRIHEDDLINANFYAELAQRCEGAGQPEQACELYRLSLLFANTPLAHEHLGNIAMESGRHHQAFAHYKSAVMLNSQSPWVYFNLARTQQIICEYLEAVNTMVSGIKLFPGSYLLTSNIDSIIAAYWNSEDQKLSCLATVQNRQQLIIDYEKIVTFISGAYAQVFRRCSPASVIQRLNTQKVLIVGWHYEALPQCYRYRIEQKMEQLEYAGYQTETVSWQDEDAVLSLINFYDFIIFYRSPALPSVLKVIEYAKSLGKVTFYELDDLLFDPVGVPPIETYGGQVSTAIYTSVTKDIGSHRAIAGHCDYAIASTLPLLERLSPLVQKKVGFLHRNGLDKYNHLDDKPRVQKKYLNLFYGSGTLAHNSDFIIEALPAISKIMREFIHVKLVTMGYINLPETYLREFKERVIQIPMNRDLDVYYTYLSASDISLAVLHDDELTACKSELKWVEAATFAIPSVVSRTKNYLDVIRQGEDGYVVYGEDEWYQALKKLVENEGLRRDIGKNAFNRIKDEYSIAGLAKNISQILTDALSNYTNSLVIDKVTEKEF